MNTTTLRSELCGTSLVPTLDRPEVMNALSAELAGELLTAVQASKERPGVRTIVIYGAGDLGLL